MVIDVWEVDVGVASLVASRYRRWGELGVTSDDDATPGAAEDEADSQRGMRGRCDSSR